MSVTMDTLTVKGWFSFFEVWLLYVCFSCPILLVTGQKSLFRNTTYSLYQSVLKQTVDKTKVEYIEIHGTANILEHKVGK